MSALHVVGVHGIWQGKGGSTQKLTSDWHAALVKGITAVAGPESRPPAMTVPSYSHVFPRPFYRLGPDDDEGPDTPMDAEEEAFVREALDVYLPDEEDPLLPPGYAETLGPAGSAPWLTRKITAIDRRTERGAGHRIVWILREVHGYLRDEDKAAQVRAAVRAALEQSGTRVVIAHSLGSVVAYDMLNRGEIPVSTGGPNGVSTLITCGSPLAWLVVRNGIAAADSPLAVPEGVEWVNVFATHDPIARGEGLGHVATAVKDEQVDNGGYGTAHDVLRYLDKPPVAHAVLRAAELD